MKTESAVLLQDVTVGYGDVPILKDINLDIKAGSFIGIIGPNGGGKTTLVKLILGLLKPWKGRVSIFGRDPDHSRNLIGYVPQAASVNRRFPISVRQVVALGRLTGARPFCHRYSPEDCHIIDWCLECLDIQDLAFRQIEQLSGGQWRKVLIARALAVQPTLLLLDEPTSGLDADSSSRVYELLKELNRSVTVVLVTHDTMAVSSYVKDIACINQTLYYHGEPEMSPELVMNLYGCPVNLIAHGVPHRVLQEHGGRL